MEPVLAFLKLAGPLRLSIVTATVLLICGFVMTLSWTPDRVVRDRQKDFIEAFENRKWGRVKSMMSDKYNDQWGHNRDEAVQLARQVFTDFTAMRITMQPSDGTYTAPATMTAVIRLEGQGSYADAAKMELNSLTSPFVFTWSQQSSLPWDWKLDHIAHPDLRMPGGF